MRIDPDSPRAKAKMHALDKLVEMLDYSNTKLKRRDDTEAPVEHLEDEIEPADGGDGQDDSDDEHFGDDEHPPEDVEEGGEELGGGKTIDMRRARMRGGPGELDGIESVPMHKKRR